MTTELSLQRLVRRRVAPLEFLQGLPADMHPVLQRVYAARNTGVEQLIPSLSRMIPVGALNGAAAAAQALAGVRVGINHRDDLGPCASRSIRVPSAHQPGTDDHGLDLSFGQEESLSWEATVAGGDGQEGYPP